MSISFERIRQMHPWPAKPAVEPIMHGWFGEPEKAALRNAICQYVEAQPIDVLEIGAWLGKSALWMVETFAAIRITCVDPWAPGSTTWLRTSDMNPMLRPLNERPLDVFRANLWPHRQRVNAVQMPSQRALPVLAGVGYLPHVIYIDGDHAYEAVKADIELCTRLFPGADLVGDDYEADWPGVVRAVDELLPGARINGGVWMWSPNL